MVRNLLALLLAAACGQAAQAAEAPALCKALHGLADAARTTDTPLRIAVSGGLGSALACRPDAPGEAGRSFCEAATAEAGPQIHALPWRLNACVQTVAADPQLTTGADYPGVPHDKLLTHLVAKLGHGVRLDASWVPAGAGRYDVVVWAAK